MEDRPMCLPDCGSFWRCTTRTFLPGHAGCKVPNFMHGADSAACETSRGRGRVPTWYMISPSMASCSALSSSLMEASAASGRRSWRKVRTRQFSITGCAVGCRTRYVVSWSICTMYKFHQAWTCSIEQVHNLHLEGGLHGCQLVVGSD